jgi:tRNA(fMet)-specific endonuclease VapC
LNRHILDTDILTLFQFGHPKVVQNAQAYSPAQLAVSVITIDEVLTGWYTKVRHAKTPPQIARAFGQLTTAVSFLSGVQIQTFTEAAVLRYQGLRSTFRRLNKNDLRIAAIVLECNDTLVTRNTSDFQQIPGLTIVDWTK